MKIVPGIFNIIKWIIIAFIIIIALATFMGKSYLQTLVLLLMAGSLAYWPKFVREKWKKSLSIAYRILFIALLFAINVIFFRPGHKTSIYTSEEKKVHLMEIYDRMMTGWPENTEDIFIETEYGRVHVLGCGAEENPPLIMIHAASMGAHSWAENLEPLLGNYRIYSIDNIGEGNKSELKDAMTFPGKREAIACLYAEIADSLGVDRSPVFGASNGGFIAMCYAWHYPKRVESLALFGPMGLTQLTGKSILMLSLASMYPFQFIRNWVAGWALGDDEYCRRKYGEWFNCIMKGTIPSVAMPVPMTTEQKKKMKLPVLLFLGTKDPIVGDAGIARKTAEAFPDIQIEVLESGHLIAVEHAADVNKKLREFLDIH